MAFALAVTHLIDAMKEPGCPICRLFRQASERAIESFLWENVNDPEIRQGIVDSYGFCQTHTRLMVAKELFSSSVALGTNIIYEHLGRVVANELKGLRPGGLSGGGLQTRLRGWLRRIGFASANRGPMTARGVCPVCEAGSNAAVNSMFVMVEELRKAGDVQEAYLKSDGICLAHLRLAVDLHTERFPDPVRFLLDDSIRRLTEQSAHMKEYIRKNNWAYRDESASEEEDTAWRKTLTFFTGYPASAFTHKSDDF